MLQELKVEKIAIRIYHFFNLWEITKKKKQFGLSLNIHSN